MEETETPEQTEARERDEKGRFVPKASTEALVEGATPEVAAEPAPVVLPEGMAAVKKIEGRELATAFKLLDADGELEIPEVTIEFEANGKTRKEPLDKVVKLAQFGVYQHEREQRLTQAQQVMQQKEVEFQQIEARARQFEQERERLLSDPDYLVQQLARYEQDNTPEARLTRDREQVEQQRRALEAQQIVQQANTFMEGELLPAIETMTTALPTVSPEEIAAKLLLIQERYKVDTPMGRYVPPTAYPALRQAMMQEVLPWAQQVHDARDSERQTVTKTAKQEVEQAKAGKLAAQVEAQKAKSLIGRTVKPGARSTQGTTTTVTTPKQLVTVQDYEDDAVRQAVQGALLAAG